MPQGFLCKVLLARTVQRAVGIDCRSLVALHIVTQVKLSEDLTEKACITATVRAATQCIARLKVSVSGTLQLLVVPSQFLSRHVNEVSASVVSEL